MTTKSWFVYLVAISSAAMVSGASVNFVSPIETFPGGGSLDQDENQVSAEEAGLALSTLVLEDPVCMVANKEMLEIIAKFIGQAMEREQEELDEDEQPDIAWPIFEYGGEYGPKRNGKAKKAYYGIMNKKDTESLLHQADPSLTVQQLPSQPQISFRKEDHFKENAHEQTTTTEIPGIHRGMKEVVMLRPATGTKSPFTDFIERLQQRQWPGIKGDADVHHA